MKNYKTDAGIRAFTEAELIAEAYKHIRHVLKAKYGKYKAEHDDMAQDVILAVYKAAMNRYNPDKGTIEAFLYGVAEKQLAKAARPIEKRPQTVSLSDELANTLPAKDETEDVEDDAEAILQEFGKTLTKRERKALRLKAEGLTNTQIYNALHPRAKKRRIGQAMTAFWKTVGKKYENWRTKQNASKP